MQLLHAFRVPLSMIPVILQHTGGHIPQVDGHIDVMRQLLIQRSRVLETDRPNGVIAGSGQSHQRQGFTHFTDVPCVGMVGGGFPGGPCGPT